MAGYANFRAPGRPADLSVDEWEKFLANMDTSVSTMITSVTRFSKTIEPGLETFPSPPQAVFLFNAVQMRMQQAADRNLLVEAFRYIVDEIIDWVKWAAPQDLEYYVVLRELTSHPAYVQYVTHTTRANGEADGIYQDGWMLGNLSRPQLGRVAMALFADTYRVRANIDELVAGVLDRGEAGGVAKLPFGLEEVAADIFRSENDPVRAMLGLLFILRQYPLRLGDVTNAADDIDLVRRGQAVEAFLRARPNSDSTPLAESMLSLR